MQCVNLLVLTYEEWFETALIESEHDVLTNLLAAILKTNRERRWDSTLCRFVRSSDAEWVSLLGANPLKKVYKLLLLFCILNIVDYITTMLAISHGAVVGNPIADHFVSNKALHYFQACRSWLTLRLSNSRRKKGIWRPIEREKGAVGNEFDIWLTLYIQRSCVFHPEVWFYTEVNWSPDHSKMGKGVTLTKEVLAILRDVLGGMSL